MPHLETFMAAVLGMGLGTKVALITDGRFQEQPEVSQSDM